MPSQIRNVAIIAHVDHGKTTLVDGLLKQSRTFRENEAAFSQTLIMDSNDQERERGITILAKNTAIAYRDTHINIIDTPGHADFGGEVERTLSMADGALLIIDAHEGPMPQTTFVLKKALDLGLRPIVVINKIDKPNADIATTLSRTYDLFLELATVEEQLEFPVYYAIGRDGKAWKELPDNPAADADLTPILDAIIDDIPAPTNSADGGFQLLVSSLDYDSFAGKYAIGKIHRGTAKPGLSVVRIKADGTTEAGKIEKVFVNAGLKRVEVAEASAGDIVAITGIKTISIGETIADATTPEALPAIAIEEPTLSITMYANTSPFAGREGTYVTARHLLERIQKELETNVSMRLEIADNGEYIVSGRGELHLSVFIETLRREGFELQVGKPQVITKEVDGVVCEPIEELTIDVAAEHASGLIGEVNRRRGVLQSQSTNTDGTTRLLFEIPTRGLLGIRNQLLTLSRGTAVMNTLFVRYEKVGTAIPKLRNGVLVASEQGKATTFALDNAQARGTTFIPHQTEVYEGMIFGLHSREDDLDMNVTKEKKLSNVRSSTSDIATILSAHTEMSLEQCLDFLEDDELLEVTPKHLRMRKKVLKAGDRYRQKRSG